MNEHRCLWCDEVIAFESGAWRAVAPFDESRDKQSACTDSPTKKHGIRA